MKKTIFITMVILIALSYFAVSLFSVSDDQGNTSTVSPSYKILIATKKGDFKEDIIKKVSEQFSKENVKISRIELKQLSAHNPGDYNAVIVINSCVAWKMDKKVRKYVEKYPDSSNIIVLTTSGDGDWAPKKIEQKYKHISCASKDAEKERVTKEIAQFVKSQLK